jgi:hypothetical protein
LHIVVITDPSSDSILSPDDDDDPRDASPPESN